MLNQDFFKEWSPEMAYVLGYFAADGSMILNKRGGHFIEFTSTDRILLELIQEIFHSTHKIQRRKQYNELWKVQYRIQIGSKEWFSDLSKLGFTQNKSNTMQFPKISEQYLGDFVRGYFDGDGCIYFNKLKYADRKYKRWVALSIFTSGSKDFLKRLHDALREYGVHGGSLRVKKHGFDLSFSHRDSLAIYRLMYHTASITDLYLPRKHKLFTKAMKTLYPSAVVA